MATGGAGTGTGTNSSDAEIKATMEAYLNHYLNNQTDDLTGIPPNEALTDKLFSLLTPETVNKVYMLPWGDRQLGWTPILLASVQDFQFAKKLITELGANILTPIVQEAGSVYPGSPRQERSPLISMIGSYADIVLNEQPGDPDAIIAVIATGLASIGNSRSVMATIDAELTSQGFDADARADFMKKLSKAMQNAAWNRRRHLAPVFAERLGGGARRRRRTRRHRSRRHRTKSRKH